MKRHRSDRKLANIRLTRKHHLPYMGLWIFLSVALVLAFNVMVYLHVESRFGSHLFEQTVVQTEYLRSRQAFVLALTVESFLAITAVVFLAILTAHRIGGPYIRLVQVFKEVESGNMEQRLKFREYDRLEVVEAAFSRMMESLQQRCPENTKEG